MSRNRNRSNNGRHFDMPQDVKDFASASLKKYKKTVKNDPWMDTDKKSIKKGYYNYLFDMLPAVTETLVYNSNNQEVKNMLPAIYEKMMDPEFIKRLAKLIDEDGKDAFDNADIFPIVVNGMLRNAKEWTKKLQQEAGDDQSITINTEDLVDLQTKLLKKRMKKMKKAGVPDSIAFDVLCALPKPTLLERSGGYWMRQVFNVLYEHAKTTKDIPFEKIVEVAVTDEFYPTLFTTMLLERKEIYVQMSESQKEFFNGCTEWMFNQMENMNKSVIYEILQSYADVRKRDKSQNRDSNRRYFMNSLPETDFPKICKVLAKLKDDYAWVDEFM